MQRSEVSTFMQEVRVIAADFKWLKSLLFATHLDGFRAVMASSFLLILHQSLCSFPLFQSLMQEELGNIW